MGILASSTRVPDAILQATVARRHDVLDAAIRNALEGDYTVPRFPPDAVLKNARFELSYLREDFADVDLGLIAEWETARTRIALRHALQVTCVLRTDSRYNLILCYSLAGTTESHIEAFKSESNELNTTARGLLELD